MKLMVVNCATLTRRSLNGLAALRISEQGRAFPRSPSPSLASNIKALIGSGASVTGELYARSDMNFDDLAERIVWVFGGLWFATLIAGVVTAWRWRG